ncbi:GntR family transcriptional regulator [Phytoactinopolyspora endophytica]|uniref:GntR family transcriptional regulator n=1 Tax=Phytoactinopolyspora endophytica TaxID=1642495 RepID=UPI00101BD7FD|nr:GntR family transcriptional regulator [Phytoactinopolyspora endophytica]
MTEPDLPLGERVYLALRADLMAGTYAPTERLGEEKLATRYKVSRTPVREALARLVSDGLVQRGDGGLFPYRARFEELAGLYELRFTLELRGIERIMQGAAPRHDRDVLGPELDSWHGLRDSPPAPDAGFVERDEGFHTTLLASSGNPAFVAALHNVNSKIRPVRMYDYLTPDRMDATIAEHVAIAEFVLDGRLDAAYDALKKHIDESREVVIDRAAQAVSAARMVAALQP